MGRGLELGAQFIKTFFLRIVLIVPYCAVSEQNQGRYAYDRAFYQASSNTGKTGYDEKRGKGIHVLKIKKNKKLTKI